MGSILSKLFGGSHNNSSNNNQEPILALPAPPITSQAGSTPGRPVNETLKSKRGPDLKQTGSGSSPVSNNNNNSVSAERPITPAKTNILEVQLDEEAFKNSQPKIYTTTLKTQIEPIPPHPLEQLVNKPQTTSAETTGKKWIHTTCSVPPKSKWCPITSTNTSSGTSSKSSSLTNLSSALPPAAAPEPQKQATPPPPEPEPLATYENNDIEHDESEIEDAVIKIQAGVRGFLTRKHLTTKSEDQKNEVEDDRDKELEEESQEKDSTQIDSTILPPPVNFESVVVNTTNSLVDEIGKIANQISTNYNKRVETPIPGSPFAKDMEEEEEEEELNHTTTEPSEPEEETSSSVNLIQNTEELEIFKKISEINRLLSFEDDRDMEEILAKTAISDPVPQEFTSTVNKVLGQLDQTIQDEEDKLVNPEEPISIVSAFGDEAARIEDMTEFIINVSVETEPEVIEQHRQNILSGIESFETTKNGLPVSSVPIFIEESPIDVIVEEEEEDNFEDQDSLTEEKAAIRIQAAFRGFEVRKSLSREHSPSRNTPTGDEEETEVLNVDLMSNEVEPALISLDPILKIPLNKGFGEIAKEEEEEEVAKVVDIEQSMKELEKSIDRDLLTDNSISTKSELVTSNLKAEPVVPIPDDDVEILKIIDTAPVTVQMTSELEKEVDNSVISSAQLTPQSPTSPISPSKIPILERTRSPTGILKEPSFESNNLAIPEPVTNVVFTGISLDMNDPNSSNSVIDDDDDDPESTSVSSPIPLRASSPNPFSKKRNRRHRKK